MSDTVIPIASTDLTIGCRAKTGVDQKGNANSNEIRTHTLSLAGRGTDFLSPLRREGEGKSISPSPLRAEGRGEELRFVVNDANLFIVCVLDACINRLYCRVYEHAHDHENVFLSSRLGILYFIL
jgi:hypothetical protein